MTQGLIAFCPFDASLPRGGFDCGNELINGWFRTQAGQQDKRHNARTHLGLATFDSRIASFFTLLTHEIALDDRKKSTFLAKRSYPVPAILIAQLAVDAHYQGQGVGRLTLAHALFCIKGLVDTVGFEAVVVDAIDEKARAFYSPFGFEPLVADGLRLVLTTRDLIRNVSTAP
ncbi:GNAT family N-acetyltransferase [Demequina sp. TTPB684]|uniref:GNAT family N-acetyltransferase n=1 Tax=unclassified Demequina TaxID=2620311 RepID=UPI001CF20113|nr:MULTISPECIES: GNAT family N-acetyltransferase [unclassified Demequina]MCB2413070.1 GNAT family N-acetyltransferase [Demequina sp. TTPB684]UPU88122.1 GNAT family N-acetyltransferase [Demequina sp. TMPB413]